MGKPKGPPPIQPCRLCGTTGPLTWSHILPQWTYRRVAQMGQPRGTVPVQVRDGVAMLNGRQLADFLLCGMCEDKFHHWETYVSEVSCSGSEFPALATALAHVIPGGVPELRSADVSTLKVDAIARFAASILWRAGACPHLLPKLRLGPYFDAFGAYLRDEAPFPAQARLLLHLMHSDEVPELSQVIAPPSSSRHHDRHFHAFLIFGMSFEFFVGGSDLSAYDYACLPRTGRALIADGHRQLPGIAHEALRSVPKGALAKRWPGRGTPPH